MSDTLDASFRGIAPNHVPVLVCLAQIGPQTVTDITRRMGVSQPAVTRMVTALRDLGLVRLTPSESDQRQSLIIFTDAGEALVERMRVHYWPAVDAAATSLFAGARGDFLAQIESVESALRQEPLAKRVEQQLRTRSQP